jgi:glutamate synthase (NADPH/NADH) large chain
VPAVHHHLIREGTARACGLVLESGEPREVHHFSLLIGYGAARSTRTSPSRRSTT